MRNPHTIFVDKHQVESIFEGERLSVTLRRSDITTDDILIIRDASFTGSCVWRVVTETEQETGDFLKISFRCYDSQIDGIIDSI